MTRSTLCPTLLGSVLLIACAERAPAPRVEKPAPPMSVIAAALSNPRMSNACSSDQATPAAATVLVFGTKQCLSCQGVGYDLRHAKADSGTELVLLIPLEDSVEVCPFLRRERVHLRVWAIPSLPTGDRLARYVVQPARPAPALLAVPTGEAHRTNNTSPEQSNQPTLSPGSGGQQ